MRQIGSFEWKIDRQRARSRLLYICNGIFDSLSFIVRWRWCRRVWVNVCLRRVPNTVRTDNYFMIDEAMMTVQKCPIEIERIEMIVNFIEIGNNNCSNNELGNAHHNDASRRQRCRLPQSTFYCHLELRAMAHCCHVLCVCMYHFSFGTLSISISVSSAWVLLFLFSFFRFRLSLAISLRTHEISANEWVIFFSGFFAISFDCCTACFVGWWWKLLALLLAIKQSCASFVRLFIFFSSLQLYFFVSIIL